MLRSSTMNDEIRGTIPGDTGRATTRALPSASSPRSPLRYSDPVARYIVGGAHPCLMQKRFFFVDSQTLVVRTTYFGTCTITQFSSILNVLPV